MCNRCPQLEAELVAVRNALANFGKYENEAERKEARLRASRRAQKKRRAEYAALCRRFQVKPRRNTWSRHLTELREFAVTGSSEYHLWWLERFTHPQIQFLAQGLIPFDVPDYIATREAA
jgi:hypothetical protein